jgi:hypothetical protein
MPKRKTAATTSKTPRAVVKQGVRRKVIAKGADGS